MPDCYVHANKFELAHYISWDILLTHESVITAIMLMPKLITTQALMQMPKPMPMLMPDGICPKKQYGASSWQDLSSGITTKRDSNQSPQL